jgi:hypothetical protein
VPVIITWVPLAKCLWVASVQADNDALCGQVKSEGVTEGKCRTVGKKTDAGSWITGNPEVIRSFVGLVPTNGLVATELSMSIGCQKRASGMSPAAGLGPLIVGFVTQGSAVSTPFAHKSPQKTWDHLTDSPFGSCPRRRRVSRTGTSGMILTCGAESSTNTVSRLCPRRFAATPRRLLPGKGRSSRSKSRLSKSVISPAVLGFLILFNARKMCSA